MASRYEISTIFKMIDNFSGPMKSIAGSSSVMAKKYNDPQFLEGRQPLLFNYEI